MCRKNLEVYQAAVKMVREKRTTGNAFGKSLLRKDTTARLSF
jgi:hypothetical protein